MIPIPISIQGKTQGAVLEVAHATGLHDDDMAALCEATNAAILDGGGFGWVSPPGQQALERYFRGVMLVPERELYVGRADGIITGSAQLVRQPRNNEAQAFAGAIMHAFVAPFARGQGLARAMTLRIEERARVLGYRVLNLDVRETQTAAIALYESLGYVCWGVHPEYARIRGQILRGYFYTKALRRTARLDGTEPADAAEPAGPELAGSEQASPEQAGSEQVGPGST